MDWLHPWEKLEGKFKMSLSSFFGFPIATTSASDSELPSIFPLGIGQEIFVETDVMNVYSKILTDCVERTQGLPEDIQSLLWDNCLQSESSLGLISLLARAMTKKQELFLVYKSDLKVIREAIASETAQIRSDYKMKGSSSVGLFVSFKNYHRTDMVKLYSGMEYCVVASLNKVMNLSKAIQYKMDQMRGSVSLVDSSVAIAQAKSLASALARGKDIMIDGKDIIETAKPDISTIKESILFLDSKKCFYYVLPLAYVNGEQTGGIGTTGEADSKAVERGLKQYFVSIIKPTFDALFGTKVSFKSNDFRQIGSALEALKTFDLVTTDFISDEDKSMIINRLFDLETTD